MRELQVLVTPEGLELFDTVAGETLFATVDLFLESNLDNVVTAYNEDVDDNPELAEIILEESLIDLHEESTGS